MNYWIDGYSITSFYFRILTTECDVSDHGYHDITYFFNLDIAIQTVWLDQTFFPSRNNKEWSTLFRPINLIQLSQMNAESTSTDFVFILPKFSYTLFSLSISVDEMWKFSLLIFDSARQNPRKCS